MAAILCAALAVLLLEALCKTLVERAGDRQLPRRFFGDRLRIEKLYNKGMMYGLGQKWPRLVLLFPLAALLGGAAWATVLLRREKGLWLKLGAGLLLGGSLSNLLDRVKNGRVLDYIRLPKLPGKRLGSTVFNLADVAIFLGALAMLAAELRQLFLARK